MVSFVDAFQPQYTEAREAADLAKRLAKVQEQQQRATMAAASAKLNSQHQQQQEGAAKPAQQHPHSLGQALMQRPALSRTCSNSTVLGGIFQSLNSSRSPSPFRASGTSTPAQDTPLLTPTRTMCQADLEAAMVAEKKRDADICAMPAWYH